MTINDKIIALTGLWYEIVNIDHHKDHDCHWYINCTYSYGNKPLYWVRHYGYLISGFDELSFDSNKEAEEYLILKLKQHIAEELKTWLRPEQHLEADQLKRVKELEVKRVKLMEKLK